MHKQRFCLTQGVESGWCVRGPVYYILIIAISFRRTREHIKGSETDLQLPKVGGKQMETSPKEIKSASGVQLSATLKAF